MNMHIPGSAEAHGGHGHKRHHRPPVVAIVMFATHWLFYAAATACFLGAVNRIAGALQLRARIKVLTELPDALDEDERAYLIEKVASSAIGYW
ncbi:MAG TPA: hypothetical protein VIK83_00445 [Coriobacteriia bacterium]